MSHLTDDELYRLAELDNDGIPFDEDDAKHMAHLAECQECYEKFCCFSAVMDVTDGAGYSILADIFSASADTPLNDSIREKVSVVIQVIAKRVQESVSVRMEQVNRQISGWFFEPPLMAASRGGSSANEAVGRLEDVESDKTFLIFDAEARALMVQIDMSDRLEESLDVYLLSVNGEKRLVELEKKGKYLRGRMDDIEEEEFQIYIEENI